MACVIEKSGTQAKIDDRRKSYNQRPRDAIAPVGG
jgi:hypothetical protein